MTAFSRLYFDRSSEIGQIAAEHDRFHVGSGKIGVWFKIAILPLYRTVCKNKICIRNGIGVGKILIFVQIRITFLHVRGPASFL